MFPPDCLMSLTWIQKTIWFILHFFNILIFKNWPSQFSDQKGKQTIIYLRLRSTDWSSRLCLLALNCAIYASIYHKYFSWPCVIGFINATGINQSVSCSKFNVEFILYRLPEQQKRFLCLRPSLMDLWCNFVHFQPGFGFQCIYFAVYFFIQCGPYDQLEKSFQIFIFSNSSLSLEMHMHTDE